MLSINLTLNTVDNKSRGAGGISSVYSWPITDDITDYEVAGGFPRFRAFDEKNQKRDSPVSPLFARYNDWGENKSTRNIIQGAVIFTPVRNLDITGRLSYDQNNYSYEGYEVPRFDDSQIYPDFDDSIPAEIAKYYSDARLTLGDLDAMKKNGAHLLGRYTQNASRSSLLTAAALATYKIDLPSDFLVEVLAGTEAKMQKSYSSSMGGRDFIIPNTYSMGNLEQIEKSDISLVHSQRRTAGIFGEARIDYKGLANLSVTYRLDWTSALRYKYSPYTYPSITGGVIFSEIFDITNNWFNYGKLRGNWAKVGKDTAPYLFDRRFSQYSQLPDGGYGTDPALSVASETLMPEMSKSWEVGVDLRFFNSRTRLDMAYYSTAVENQIVTVRVSPSAGYILQTRNEGDIENRGIEITLDQDIIRSRDWLWTTSLNFGLNRGIVNNLPEDVIEVQGTQYSDIFPTAYLHGSTTAISGKDYERTADGQVIVEASGLPRISPAKSVLIGNREPDFLLGLSSVIDYKGISLSFLLDGRKGGDVVNVTGRGLISSGQHKMMETYRGRQVVWNGVVEQPDGSYIKNTTPIVLDNTIISNYYHAVSSNFIEDGSYIRLSYVTLGYDFAKFFKSKDKISSLRCSFTGQNLFLLTKYTGSDPQINPTPTSGGTGAMGIDNYPVPNTRSFNFTVSVNF